MKTNIYSIFDTVAGIFNAPFTQINNATAIRAFTNSVHDSPNKDDYVLYKLAQLDDNNGDIEKLPNPEKILTGLEVKIPENLQPQSGAE